MTLKYLITGATGALGAGVLSYLIANVPASEYAAASSKEENRKQFEDRGIAFRVASYDDPQTLETAFEDVENLFFVSTNTFDNAKRRKQHENFIEAAKKMNVKHVWYTSLAFGGYSSDSKAAVQQTHLMTEEMMRQAGINFTSIREGLYTDAFPVFMGWYPSTSTVYLPSDGPIAFTLRSELGEANARLMIRGGYDREIVLLTAQQTITFSEIVDLINETTGRNVQLKLVSPEEFVRLKAADDEGGKPEGFFQALLSWYESISKGETCTIDPLMAEVLDRQPVPPREAIRAFLTENRDYEWHQNYVNRG
ncbi:unnamed protein product [Penicillium nalgiovense]|uniref:NmrA-like domain-containing protein n=1 Tax=Penicillium nalgiovense TaxID=60175 RepID=A0A1V6X8S0_PENNA|nr:hypothetical protein PENNAL_c0105G02266 [Penicillium nalgiovense]CAG7994499.1 unnamed protein product [Penicillium nalgiovense]CAG8003977.1 unnamed protein product [Penicillium nalgiovense]CAG8020430.1 unnamed protein product [Penicillium nalgiovense]CAG8025570.1 unnamed protein product [Penicillium nalgiovense]